MRVGELECGWVSLGVARKLKQAKVIDAWTASQRRVEEKQTVEAKQRATGDPLTLSTSEHVSLRRSYEEKERRVDDKDYPADVVIDRRLQEVEQGDNRA